MKVISSLVLLSLLVLLGAATAGAQTPDGEPPSEENVCDPWSGESQAFGLCNAYCEAMDCDSPDVKASERACERKFMQFMQLTGEAPPCTGLSCPCNGSADFPFFTSFLSATPPVIESCMSSQTGTSISVVLNTLFESAEADGEVDMEGSCGSSADNGGVPLPVTPEEGEVCALLLLMAAEDQEVTCEPL